MANKKDLRIQKTEKAVREAFLELRKTTPLEKMRVRDICQKAMINTSTFYTHYSDVYALSDHLENELISGIIDNLPDPYCLFTDMYRLCDSVRQGIVQHLDTLTILFSGRHEVVHEKVINQFMKYYITEDTPKEERTRVYFAVGGIMHAAEMLLTDGETELDDLWRDLGKLISKL